MAEDDGVPALAGSEDRVLGTTSAGSVQPRAIRSLCEQTRMRLRVGKTARKRGTGGAVARTPRLTPLPIGVSRLGCCDAAIAGRRSILYWPRSGFGRAAS